MFLISHETKPMCFLSLGPPPGRSYSCLDMVNSADVNASPARPRAPLGKLGSDTKDIFAFFFLHRNSATLCATEPLRCFHRVLCSQQAAQAPVTKPLEGDLGFCTSFSFKNQPAKFMFPGSGLETLAGSDFSAALREQPGQWSLQMENSPNLEFQCLGQNVSQNSKL